MPVQCADFELVPQSRDALATHTHCKDEHDRDADTQMKGVQARRAEVQKVKQHSAAALGRFEMKVEPGNEMLLPLAVIFEAFECQEHETESAGETQERDARAALLHFCSAYGKRHQQAAGEQDDRVDGADHNIGVATR